MTFKFKPITQTEAILTTGDQKATQPIKFASEILRKVVIYLF